MKILFLSRWFPYPANNGSKIRILNLLTHLAERHEVSLLSFGRPDEVEGADRIAHLTDLCRTVRVLPHREFQPASARALAGALSREPRFLVDTFQHAMRDAVVQEVAHGRPDVVVASQLDMAPYALAVPGVPALLEELELSVFEEHRRQAHGSLGSWRATLSWLKLVGYLRRVMPRFRVCTVASELERNKLRRAVPHYANVHVVPNALDLRRYGGNFGPPEVNSLIYAGALTYDANYDAVAYFVREVLPSIARAEPRVRLRVTGDITGVELGGRLRDPRVEYTGYLADIRPVVAQSWASVVPLRRGGGTRLKVLEAMALGTPVVSTSKGAEGLHVRDGEHLLLADDPDAFAARVVELLRAPQLRARLAAGGRSLVASTYDARDAGEHLCRLVERAAVGGPG